MKVILLMLGIVVGFGLAPLQARADDNPPVIAPATGNSSITEGFKDNCSGTSGGTCHTERGFLVSLFLKIGSILTLLAGILAVFVIVINGIRYVSSAGDPAKAKTARDGIIAALVGVIIAVMAYFFIHLAQIAGGYLSTL